MNQFNFNSFIDFISELFSELPPRALAIIVGFGFLGLMVFCGFSVAFVIGLLALFLTQSGIVFAGIYILCVALFTVIGLVKGFQFYKKIMLSYETQQN
jgi:hypothetical protein